ncbi:Ribophorin I [Pilobolus umbonatus]|nr:Ribophorin I [Pilobolus umbonatus]
MFSVRFILKLTLTLYFSCVVLSFPLQFQNSKVIRSIDVRNTIAREEIGIRATNIDNIPVSDYYLYLPTPLNEKLATIKAYKKNTKQDLTIELYEIDAQKGMHVYRVLMDKPIQPAEDTVFIVHVAYSHSIKALPAKLPQIARQFSVYATNSYFISPYFTKEVKTTVVTPTKNIASHKGAGDQSGISGNKVTYGPYHNIPPFSFSMATCHFENPKPLITITELQRDIEISHWGNNIAVEEHYALHNDGASLDKEFNRVQYQMTAHIHDQLNVLRELHFTLPASARDVYFRDEIGNVSTSNFRVEKEKAVLDIQPRYPVFGGWNYTWYQGYNADLGQFVHKSKTGYILNIKYVDNVNDMTIDKAVVRVILPEGAVLSKITMPFRLDQSSEEKHYTYFDSTGRQMIILTKNNVIRDHEEYFQVNWTSLAWMSVLIYSCRLNMNTLQFA